jgi:hypothetical protein
MNSPLTDDVWTRRGISVLWDGHQLADLDAASKVISLRRFFELHEAGWPEEEIPFINDQGLMVAGLDVAIDALDIDEAVNWIEQQVYMKIYDFQTYFDGQCALIFWMADQGRWKENPSEYSYEWHLSGKHKGQMLPIGKCIWNGAQNGVRRIEVKDATGKMQWVGLYHHRIS